MGVDDDDDGLLLRVDPRLAAHVARVQAELARRLQHRLAPALHEDAEFADAGKPARRLSRHDRVLLRLLHALALLDQRLLLLLAHRALLPPHHVERLPVRQLLLRR